MRIEGISEGSASQLTGHAFEQHVPVPANHHAAALPPDVAARTAGRDLVDVHDSTAAAPPRQEVEYRAPTRVIVIGPEQQGVIDRNGDGKIDLSDLPFDYFQIMRQSHRKLLDPPANDLAARPPG